MNPLEDAIAELAKIRSALHESVKTGKPVKLGIVLAVGDVEATIRRYLSPVSLEEQKQHLSKNGWSYRAAALVLGVSVQWLKTVLNGWQISETLAARILSLPVCPDHLMSAKARNRMQSCL